MTRWSFNSGKDFGEDVVVGRPNKPGFVPRAKYFDLVERFKPVHELSGRGTSHPR